MARISSYPIDSTIQDKDAWIGTESTNRATRNFTAEDIAAYVVASTSAITGSGTINTIPMFTPTGVKIGDSIITQAASGQAVTVTGQLDVTGSTELSNTLTVGGVTTFNAEVECSNNVTVQGVFAADGSSVFSGSLTIDEQLIDGTGGPGTAGQVLSSTGTGVEWINSTGANTTYDLSGAVSNTNEFAISLLGSDNTLDKVNLIPGTNITLTDNGSNGVTIDAAGGGISGTLAQTLALGNTTGGNDVIFSNGDNLSISTASGSDFLIKSSLTDETLIALRPDNGVSLYYNNDKKSETTSYGFRVGGDLRVTGFLDLFQGDDNTFAGSNAGNLDNIIGSTNTGFGENTQAVQSTGQSNASLGFGSLKSSVNGNNNTAIGTNSLSSSSGASFNTALGSGSLSNATLGQGNTAIGYNALENKTTTNFNTAVGNNSLGNITSGFRNTAVGNNAGKFILDGTTANAIAQNSVFIGDEAKAEADGQTNQIVIGQGAIGNGANTATLGNDSVTETYLKGNIQTPGDIESSTNGKGLVLTAANGSRWRQTISNTGVPVYTQV